MKVLLFTHIVDIDGMGSAVLSKLAFESVDVVYCDTFEITEKLNQKLEDNSIYDYDQIFVTDICPDEELIIKIENDLKLKDKFQILDHHKSIIEKMKAEHYIAKIVVENNGSKCSGTSLFYEYLISKNLLLSTSLITEFVELTRQYDTWEWKTKYNNEKANELNIMFSIFGYEKYVEKFFNKLRNNLKLFNEDDLKQIEKYKQKQKSICEAYIKTIHIEHVNGFAVGVIDDMKDEYKNDVAELLKTYLELNIDLVAMLISARNTLSFRSIKPEIDVSKLAEHFGGKGHKAAASCELNNYARKSFNIKLNFSIF